MLTVIAGEDSSASRAKFFEMKKNYEAKEYTIQEIAPSFIVQMVKDAGGVVDLFGREQIYTVSNLSSVYKGRVKTPQKEAIIAIAKDARIHLLDWEDGKSAYDLTSFKKVVTSFLEHKPARSIFDLLESIYPGNRRSFFALLNLVLETQAVEFVYNLMWKHVRKLLIATEGYVDPKTHPWQKGKILSQAKRWNQPELVKLYEALARIDLSQKTGATPYNLRESLELVMWYHVR